MLRRHRRAPPHVRGQADLPDTADRPVELLAHRIAEAYPSRRSTQRQRDRALAAEGRHDVPGELRGDDGREVWHWLRLDGEAVARCRCRCVERLMRVAGLRSAVRSGRLRAARSAEDPAAVPQDLVQRQFAAERPKQLWLADCTCVATWRGVVYVAFVVDAFSLRGRSTVLRHQRGRAHTCRLPDERLFCWGANGLGKLGEGKLATRWRPVWVTGARPFYEANQG